MLRWFKRCLHDWPCQTHVRNSRQSSLFCDTFIDIYVYHIFYITHFVRTVFAMHILDFFFAPPLNIDQTFASNADVTVHAAQMYNVLTNFSLHMIKHVLSLFVHEKILHRNVCVLHFGQSCPHMSAEMFLVTGQAFLASFVMFRARSNILFFLHSTRR